MVPGHLRFEGRLYIVCSTSNNLEHNRDTELINVNDLVRCDEIDAQESSWFTGVTGRAYESCFGSLRDRNTNTGKRLALAWDRLLPATNVKGKEL